MSEEENSRVTAAEDDDLSTTPPNPPQSKPQDQASASGWVMPKPVFRQSSGFEPKAVHVPEPQVDAFFEDTTAVPNKVLEEAAELAAAQRSGDAAESDPAGAVTTVAVEPQPDITEVIVDDTPAASPATPQPIKRSGAGRVITVLLVILAVIAVIAIFLFLVTYLFLSKSGDGAF